MIRSIKVLTALLYFSAPALVNDSHLSDIHMTISGDQAAAWGIWHMQIVPAQGGDPQEITGRYLGVAKR